jgi:hypothetical protein
VIAEKLSALVALDLDNSRMKDFFDLWTLAKRFPLAGERLGEAISATFARRGILLPASTPTGLSAVFSGSTAIKTQWDAFLRQSVSPALQSLTLEEVVSILATFLLPVLEALRAGETMRGHGRLAAPGEMRQKASWSRLVGPVPVRVSPAAPPR